MFLILGDWQHMLTKEEKKYYKAIFIRDRKVFFGMYMVQILQVGIAALQPILMMKLINDALACKRYYKS